MLPRYHQNFQLDTILILCNAFIPGCIVVGPSVVGAVGCVNVSVVGGVDPVVSGRVVVR